MLKACQHGVKLQNTNCHFVPMGGPLPKRPPPSFCKRECLSTKDIKHEKVYIMCGELRCDSPNFGCWMLNVINMTVGYETRY